jgi:endonuclease/exonuclease/phosphatase (EEP) superfamily protein YafD
MTPHLYTSLVFAAALLASGCAHTTNLTSPAGPRFEGHYGTSAAALPAPGGPIRIVSFNIKHAREIDRAIRVLGTDSLRDVDVLALQEMDDAGVERIAKALRLDYAYYPASIHPASGRYFGPAVLSRWPIERSWKVVLPHAGWTRGQRRTATAAVVRIQGIPLLVYAVHLETPVQISDAERRDQIMTIIDDARAHPGPVVIAGDFNSEGVGLTLERQGYEWQTERVGPTIAWFAWDHIFTRGLSRPARGRSGAMRDVGGASDHRPVWALVSLPRTANTALDALPYPPEDVAGRHPGEVPAR